MDNVAAEREPALNGLRQTDIKSILMKDCLSQ